MESVISFAHRILKDNLRENSICVDFTAGRGNDSLFLALTSPEGKVYAFDIQEEAIKSTSELLRDNGITNTQLILDSHANIDKYVKEPVSAGIFNLGYLPQSDKSVTTLADSTVTALTKGLNLLEPGGIIVIVVYVGHDNGKMEELAVMDYIKGLSSKHYNAVKYSVENHKDAPFVLIVEKKRDLK